MKTKKILFCFLALLIALFSFLPIFDIKQKKNPNKELQIVKASGFNITEDENISAKRAILMDKETGFVLYSKNPDETCGIASTTKIMTAILTIENVNLDEKVCISKEAVGIEGSSIYLSENEVFTVLDLLYGLLLESGNDSAVALALHVGKSIENFSEMMNNKAKELGMTNSNFNNPHGLSDKEHYSTARDMGILSCYAMKNETFRQIVSTKKHTITPQNSNKTRFLINHNKLLWKDDNITGIKTGYTIATGRCLISSYVTGNNELICVTLDSPDHWNDHQKLFSSGINAYEKRIIAEKEEYSMKISVTGGKESYVNIANVDKIELMLPKEAKIDFKVVSPPFVYSPINEKDILGEVRVYCEGKIIYSFPLYATENVETKKVSLFKKIIGKIFQGL